MAKLREAMLYEKLGDQAVRCQLCGHECVIAAGAYGLCRVRENVAGELRSHSYGQLVATHVDPIEKKPLFHFLPGTTSMSIAAAGCNFQCEFCQNWQISQTPRDGSAGDGQVVSPAQVVAAAQAHGCASISYTYTEPTIFFEMAYETARLARGQGIANCFVSNGYLSPAGVKKIAPHLDAINVDLKAFRDETYRRVMKAHLAPVLTCLKSLRQAGVWTEITTLIVPGMNDSAEELRDIARFISCDLSPSTPWHVSRFHGDYMMTGTPATPMTTLELACHIGREEGLLYVYCGNVPGHDSESTCCPSCGGVVIQRSGFTVRANRLRDGRCPDCGQIIEGVWVSPSV